MKTVAAAILLLAASASPTAAQRSIDPALLWAALSSEDLDLRGRAIITLRGLDEATILKISECRILSSAFGTTCLLQDLGRLGPRRAELPLYMRFLQYGHPQHQRLALACMAKLGPAATEAVPLIRNLVGDTENRTKRWQLYPEVLSTALTREAYLTLVHIAPDTPRAMEQLLHIIEHGPSYLRNRAKRLLEQVGPRSGSQLVNLLNHPRPEIRRRAMLTLLATRRPDTGTLFAVRNALRSGHTDVKSVCAMLLARFVAEGPDRVALFRMALLSREPAVRIEAVRALDRLATKNPEAALALIPTFGDRDGQVSSLALRSFVQHKPKAADGIPALIKAVQQAATPFDTTGPCAAKALATYGDEAKKALPALVHALRTEYRVKIDGYWDQKRGLFWAADALGHLGPRAKDAIPALEEALRYDGVMVAKCAARALERIRGK